MPMPAGCLMGSGAEASEDVPMLLMSICSTADTSMGCSRELWVEWDRQVVSAGPRGQQSPPTNFNGLWEEEEGDIYRRDPTSRSEGQRCRDSLDLCELSAVSLTTAPTEVIWSVTASRPRPIRRFNIWGGRSEQQYKKRINKTPYSIIKHYIVCGLMGQFNAP